MSTDTCKDCRYWKDTYEYSQERYGQCRIEHPRVIDSGDTEWPYTPESQWCGEFQPKEAPK
jgi:hypothetical protein